MATGGVDLHMTTIGEKLQEASFYTAWFGKWCVRAELDLAY
jgi:arylsulfatase A-like enzyme